LQYAADNKIFFRINHDKTKCSPILSIEMLRDIPADERLHVQVQLQTSEAFKARLNSARTRSNEFFKYKENGDIDLCYHRLPIRIAPDTPNL
jgi:hypothetical protein